jgi:UDP-GlcNAc:undecaprenyl-phosphate/decaprenyl-phosphate GlcNAc-1-phosphate transferase
MIFFLTFATALLLSLGLTPIATRIATRTGAMDQPAPRRVHAQPTPRLGGLPIFIAFFGAIGVSLLYPRSDPNELPRLAGLLIGSALVFAVGAYDDYRELKALPQLAAQVIAASIAAGAGVLIREIPNPFGGAPLAFETWFAILFTLFWLVGMMNTVNWLDGIDGLAGGVIVIAGAVMFVHTYRLEQYSITLLALALVGTVVGFLFFNFFPAKIFLGSAGANVLGLALGVLSIIGGAKVATALLVLGIPILDVAWQILSRLRAGKSPFSADRGHLHHRLLDLGLSQRAIVILYYTFTATSGALALVLPSGIYKLIALVVIGIGALLVLVKLGQHAATTRPPNKNENRE